MGSTKAAVATAAGGPEPPVFLSPFAPPGGVEPVAVCLRVVAGEGDGCCLPALRLKRPPPDEVESLNFFGPAAPPTPPPPAPAAVALLARRGSPGPGEEVTGEEWSGGSSSPSLDRGDVALWGDGRDAIRVDRRLLDMAFV